MFKRLFWLMIGAGFGFGVSFWLARFVKQTMERYTPERVSSDVAGALRAFGSDLRAAAGEVRTGMQEREAELRADLERPASRRPLPRFWGDLNGWSTSRSPQNGEGNAISTL